MGQIKIHEQQDPDGRTIYHWEIQRDDGSEFSHSAYHIDRAVCEAEAKERLAQAQREDWI